MAAFGEAGDLLSRLVVLLPFRGKAEHASLVLVSTPNHPTSSIAKPPADPPPAHRRPLRLAIFGALLRVLSPYEHVSVEVTVMLFFTVLVGGVAGAALGVGATIIGSAGVLTLWGVTKAERQRRANGLSQIAQQIIAYEKEFKEKDATLVAMVGQHGAESAQVNALVEQRLEDTILAAHVLGGIARGHTWRSASVELLVPRLERALLGPTAEAWLGQKLFLDIPDRVDLVRACRRLEVVATERLSELQGERFTHKFAKMIVEAVAKHHGIGLPDGWDGDSVTNPARREVTPADEEGCRGTGERDVGHMQDGFGGQ